MNSEENKQWRASRIHAHTDTVRNVLHAQQIQNGIFVRTNKFAGYCVSVRNSFSKATGTKIGAA